MKKLAPIIVIERTREERIEHLVSLYGKADASQLETSFSQIAKRLGHQNAKQASNWVSSGNLDLAADLALSYYDRTYKESLLKKKNQVLMTINVSGCSHSEAGLKILEQTKHL